MGWAECRFGYMRLRALTSGGGRQTETAPNRDGVGAAFFGPGVARPLWALATERLLRPPLRDGLHDLSTQLGISQKAVDERR